MILEPKKFHPLTQMKYKIITKQTFRCPNSEGQID